jgi:hypothetical protein
LRRRPSNITTARIREPDALAPGDRELIEQELSWRSWHWRHSEQTEPSGPGRQQEPVLQVPSRPWLSQESPAFLLWQASVSGSMTSADAGEAIAKSKRLNKTRVHRWAGRIAGLLITTVV